MPAVTELASTHVPDAEDVRNVLRYTDFRRLWIALSLSSLGDWLGFYAMQAIAKELSTSRSGASFAIGGVLAFRLLPALVLGPFAGVFADRFDRRKTMVICDILRFSIFVSIPLVRSIPYLLVASFVVEAISLFWIPAKEASVPNLLPAHKLEAANTISLITTYGTAPIAAVIFAGLGTISLLLSQVVPFFETRQTDLALYFDGATFLFSAFTISRLSSLRGKRRDPNAAAGRDGDDEGIMSSITVGWKFIRETPLIRGLVVGILGAFAAGGVVVGVAAVFVEYLHGGNAGIGLIFGAVFTGLALGMAAGPRLFSGFSRRRLFALSIIGAGGSLTIDALVPNLVLALIMTTLVGVFAGIAWVTGYTLLGANVEDHLRGRTFASVQSLVRVNLLLTLTIAPILAGTIDTVLGDAATDRINGVTLTVFMGGLVAVFVGMLSYKQMVEPGSPPLVQEILQNLPFAKSRPRLAGVLVALEGGEGAGKSTQARLLAEWLEEQGHEVVVTFEPGATAAGSAIRALLLDPSSGGLAPEAEALLYAADRADHVARVVRPALERGAIVVTDRYVASSLAYQGGGRQLSLEEVRKLSEWGTCGLRADLTVLLDVEPEIGLRRAGDEPDRIEAESLEFHRRVRETFRELAGKDRRRFVIVDASGSPDQVQADVRAAVEQRLGLRLASMLADAGDERVAAPR